VHFRRSLSDPKLAQETAAVKAELESRLDALPIEKRCTLVRAFSYFSQLLNIAEDAHQNAGAVRTRKPGRRAGRGASVTRSSAPRRAGARGRFSNSSAAPG
jgi:phosphoenolpyruvate carboxylase